MFDDESPPEYLHSFPFRFVKPYAYTYKTFAKQRWVKRELYEVLVKEFKAYDSEYYLGAILDGNIQINGKQVAPEYVIKNGDEIIHKTTRNEPPILDLPINIIHEDESFVIVQKPPSLIVHTGGGHHFNTLMALLYYQMNYTNLYVLHRLDKCTSGLLFLAKDKTKTIKFHQESQKQTMKKMYYARVGGNFAWQEKTLDASIQCISHKDGIYKVFKENILEEKSEIKQKQQQTPNVQQKQQEKPDVQQKQQEKPDKKMKVKKNNKNEEEAKESKTFFIKKWYDEETDSSLLQCYPITGRTHQIRVHLQYLGFPILNDVSYGGKFIGNGILKYIHKYPEKIQIQAEKLEIVQRLQIQSEKPQIQADQKQDKEKDQGLELDVLKKKIKLNENQVEEIKQYGKVEDWDFETRPWEILLHSFKYKFEGKQYKSSLPYWFEKQSLKPMK